MRLVLTEVAPNNAAYEDDRPTVQVSLSQRGGGH
jgi:hypothetical protein